MRSNSVSFIPLTTLDASTINAGTYTAINPDGLLHPCLYVYVVNDNNTAIFISQDDDNDHLYVPADSTAVLPAQTYALPQGEVALWPAGFVFYVRGTAGNGTIALAGVINKRR